MRTKLRTPHPPLRLSATICCWVALVASSTTSHAAVITWTAGAGSTSWHTAGNWDLGRVPTAGDDVVIPNLGAVTEVEYSTGTTSVASVSCAEDFRLSGGRLAAEGVSSFSA
ncbi:MAG: hypothetical protein U0527_16340, partial [Candidatus Eisenbacteria bacterium]